MSTVKFKILYLLSDNKVNADSAFGIMSVKKYLSLVEDAIKNDELLLQRGKETRKREVYRRLKEDLKTGTIVPTISIALHKNLIKNAKIGDTIELKKDDIYILDGLQRTYALIQAKDELVNKKKILDNLLNTFLRIEVWINASLNSLLYKMVVLNSGQTPMSLRHQIEILNKPFLIEFKKNAPTEVEIFTWKDKSKRRTKSLQYLLSDLVELFLSFVDGTPFVEKNNLIVNEIQKIHYLDEYSGLKDKYGDNEKVFKEFVFLITQLDINICKKYSAASDYENGNYLMKSKTFLSGLLAAFGSVLISSEGKYNKKKSELFNLIKSQKNDPLYLEILSKIMTDLKSKSRRWGDTERTHFHNAFVIFVNDISSAKTFDKIWNEAVPSIIQ